MTEHQRLIKKLDRVFSEYIRRKNAVSGLVICVTCGKRGRWKNMDAGHFIKRQYMSTRYNEYNVNVQCKKCNWLEQGANEKYERYIKERYGENILNQLYWLKSQSKKYSKTELQELIKIYQQLIKKP